MELLVCLFLESLAFNQRICFAHQTQTRFLYTVATRTKCIAHNGAFLIWLSWCQEKQRLRDFELEKVTGAATARRLFLAFRHCTLQRETDSIGLYMRSSCCWSISAASIRFRSISGEIWICLFAAAWKRQRDRRHRRFSVSKKNLTVFRMSIFFLLDIFLMQVDWCEAHQLSRAAAFEAEMECK
jgi:hypothetical protein